jgi:tetratricopeptide (TPR) repeat protein
LFPDRIPVSILENSTLLDFIDRSGRRNRLKLALEVLYSFSMASNTTIPGQIEESISIPRLVSLYVRHEAKADAKEWISIVSVALHVVESSFPLATITSRSAGSSIMPQLRAVMNTCDGTTGNKEIEDLLMSLKYKRGRHLYYTGQFKEADKIFYQCLEDCKSYSSEEKSNHVAELKHCLALTQDALGSPDALVRIDDAYESLNAVGLTDGLRSQIIIHKARIVSRVKPKEAQKMLFDALKACKKSQQGREDVRNILILQTLAEISQTQRDYGQAAEFFNEARGIAEKSYGVENSLTIELIFGQVETLRSLGEISSADMLLDRLTRAVVIPEAGDARQPIRGKLQEVYKARSGMWKENPMDQIHLQDFIGRTSIEEHQYDTAVEWFSSAFDRAREVFGSQSPVTVHVQQNLADALAMVFKYVAALEYIDQVIEARLSTRVDSRGVLTAKQTKANVLIRRGDIGKATELAKEIYAESCSSWGQPDGLSLSSLAFLGQIYSIRGEFDKAIDKYKKALSGFEKDPSAGAQVALVRQRIATVRREQGKPKKAQIILQDILQSHSEYNAMRVEIQLELALALLAMGDIHDAHDLCLDATCCLETCGRDGDILKQFACEVKGECFQGLGRLADALQCYKEALQHGQTQQPNPNHPDVLQVKMRMGRVNAEIADMHPEETQSMRHREEAKNLYAQCFSSFQDIFGSDNYYTKTARSRLNDMTVPPALSRSQTHTAKTPRGWLWRAPTY